MDYTGPADSGLAAPESVGPDGTRWPGVAAFEEWLQRVARAPIPAGVGSPGTGALPSPAQAPGPEHYPSCKVVLVSGDSNSRGIFGWLSKGFEEAGHRRLFKYPEKAHEKMPCNGKMPAESCEPRWCDQTWVFGPQEGGRCTVALLFRFMHNQGALERVVADPFETLFCSALTSSKGVASPERFALFKSKPSCRDALRLNVSTDMLAMLPSRVDLVWHSHGLWGLDAMSKWFVPGSKDAQNRADAAAKRKGKWMPPPAPDARPLDASYM